MRREGGNFGMNLHPKVLGKVRASLLISFRQTRTASPFFLILMGCLSTVPKMRREVRREEGF
jgi:hypothetical protein